MRCLTVGILAGLVLAVAPGTEPSAAEKKGKPSPADFARAKLETAGQVYKLTVEAYRGGRTDAEAVYRWSRRWLEAERDLGDKKADPVVLLKAHRDRMKTLRETAVTRYRAGQGTQAEALGAEFYLAEAELWLLQAAAK